MNRCENPHLWIPRKAGSVTRWHRDTPGGYTMRHVMDPSPTGRPAERKWALFCGDNRVWDVQPAPHLGAAIEQAEQWITGR